MPELYVERSALTVDGIAEWILRDRRRWNERIARYHARRGALSDKEPSSEA
jgi:hypothetical protein